ncbi:MULTISPECIES: SURF1 family protein [unclassified Cryobacterium]|uniref:SURF1 family protein n=1 Tax=unclassified Cryobacterium TaxID=2649013 RepID=UPI001F5415C0|nr:MULTISPECIES: SURF1 family protein [unclassified Cryobacterium]
MMLRPRWVLALLLALGVAAAFAILGQWQLERAIDSGEVVQRTTETVLPLADVVQPGGAAPTKATGQMVRASGAFVPGDDQLVSDRFNGGTSGFWVVGHFVTDTDSASIPVARGWAADEDDARAVMAALATDAPGQAATITGRFVPAEAPEVPGDGRDPHTMTTVSPAALLNLWAEYTEQPVYSGYLVDTDAADGLTVIDSPVPGDDVELNWLNIFYALEWAVFAGFAVFLWYRLVRDAWERERDEAEAAAAAT